ncbi:MAG: peptidase [Lachnospiraceae bacterium]|nr:peptidase [Lachnospiraceae bacterium]
MFQQFKKKFPKSSVNSRVIILVIIAVLLAATVIQRLFYLQIVMGESYQENFSLSILKTKTINAARGNIYDRNGVAIAYNEISYCVTFEDNLTYDSTKEKNLSINSTLYHIIKLIEEEGDSVDSVVEDFKISIADDGSWYYNSSGYTLNRFKADIFGESNISDLEANQLNIEAADLMEILCGGYNSEYAITGYGLLDDSITAQEREEYDLPETYTQQEILQIVAMRANIAAYSYQRYQAVTIAEGISDQTVARILENISDYPGIDISEEYIRVYDYAECMAGLIGYTGQVSSEELEELQEVNSDYSATDIVGKSGLESVYETTLQGTKGYETLYVNYVGQTQEVVEEVDAQAGNDLYLTIDVELQEAAYQMLEQEIAGILYSKVIPVEEYNTENLTSADEVYIAYYDLYYALFENNILSVSHLKSSDASENEQTVYQAFLIKASEIFEVIRQELLSDDPTIYKDLDEEYQVYVSYIVNDMLMEDTGILNEDAIDKTDATYIAWTEDSSISLKEYLTYAISQNWIDVSKLNVEDEYLDSDEMYSAIADYIADYLYEDDDFCRQVYRYMLKDQRITGEQICMLLFDQGVLEMNESQYERLESGSLSGYTFLMDKIYNLEITPSQLGLTPCSGTVVITDVNSGEVLACVSYPGYDNNRLANDMDDDYYYSLLNNSSSPFYSRATQEAIAPGSTFKIVSAAAGVSEGVVSINESIYCTGTFDLVSPEINCWNTNGHGALTLSEAITKSCNYYFNTVGYRLSAMTGTYSDEAGIEILKKYAAMFGLTEKSGVEVSETSPHFATSATPQAAMGQSDHTYTATQLARYVSTIANGGTSYYLTLVKYTSDSSGAVLEENEPEVGSTVELSDELWDAIHSGMRGMVQNSSAFSGFTGVAVAGKTGTTQITTSIPNHATFIGYAPYDNPEIGIVVRIANGYTSANAAALARNVISYYYGIEDEDTLITGKAYDVDTGIEVND